MKTDQATGSSGVSTNDEVEALLVKSPQDVSEGMAWLREVWQWFLDTGLYFSGGPAGNIAHERNRLIDRIQTIAGAMSSVELQAEADRITAHALNSSEQYARAALRYERAIQAFDDLGQRDTAARTRLGYAASLQMIDSFEDALTVCKQADNWFVENGDKHGHARALVNTGNIYHRMGEHAKALNCHLEAARIFERHGDGHDQAALALNLANSYALMDRFEQADDMYTRAESIASQRGLHELADQARYNGAYLNYLRGHYSRALDALAKIRNQFVSSKSWRHAALCDLDQSEIYLQLNLEDDAARLAARARQAFNRLALPHEEAKAAAYLGCAHARRGLSDVALLLLDEAHCLFANEHNDYWTGMVELQQAEILLSLGRLPEAGFLAQEALERYERLRIPQQTGTALITLGRVQLEADDESGVQVTLKMLMGLMSDSRVPLLRFPAHLLAGRIHDRYDRQDNARQQYILAAQAAEKHRTYINQDELKLRFLEGKQAPYESLVRLDLDSGPEGVESAFEWCERAKGVALSDLLAQQLPSLHAEADAATEHVNRLAEELHSRSIRHRHRHGGGEFAGAVPAGRIGRTQVELEHETKRLESTDASFRSLFRVRSSELDAARRALPLDTTLVEYFVSADEVLVFLVTNDDIKVHQAFTTREKLAGQRDLLDFQMQQFALGEDYVHNHQKQMLDASTELLEQLYTDLVSPWIEDVQTSCLLVVPHSDIHALPLHAFYDGSMYLGDRFRISYAPSVYVFGQVSTRERKCDGRPLLVGRADHHAPAIDDEIEHLHALMPDSLVLSGSDATRERVFEAAREASILHISTHSFFLKHNPMFSGFYLADGPVTAIELYSRRWPMDLVSLSGCQSGVSSITSSDDLLGLLRGFFHTGASSLILSSWNISDAATAMFTESFYRNWIDCHDKRKSIQTAMADVRSHFPHPFYWASFTLNGAV